LVCERAANREAGASRWPGHVGAANHAHYRAIGRCSPADESHRSASGNFGVRFALMRDGLLSAPERATALRDFERNLRAEIDRLTRRPAAFGPATPSGLNSLLMQAVALYEVRLAWVLKERRRVGRGGKRKS
jgi:hypothetical protein